MKRIVIFTAISLMAGLIQSKSQTPPEGRHKHTARWPAGEYGRGGLSINYNFTKWLVGGLHNTLTPLIDLCPPHYKGPSSFIVGQMGWQYLNPVWTPILRIDPKHPAASLSDPNNITGNISGLIYFNGNSLLQQVFRVPAPPLFPKINAPANISQPRWPLWGERGFPPWTATNPYPGLINPKYKSQW